MELITNCVRRRTRFPESIKASVVQVSEISASRCKGEEVNTISNDIQESATIEKKSADIDLNYVGVLINKNYAGEAQIYLDYLLEVYSSLPWPSEEYHQRVLLLNNLNREEFIKYMRVQQIFHGTGNLDWIKHRNIDSTQVKHILETTPPPLKSKQWDVIYNQNNCTGSYWFDTKSCSIWVDVEMVLPLSCPFFLAILNELDLWGHEPHPIRTKNHYVERVKEKAPTTGDFGTLRHKWYENEPLVTKKCNDIPESFFCTTNITHTKPLGIFNLRTHTNRSIFLDKLTSSIYEITESVDSQSITNATRTLVYVKCVPNSDSSVSYHVVGRMVTPYHFPSWAPKKVIQFFLNRIDAAKSKLSALEAKDRESPWKLRITSDKNGFYGEVQNFLAITAKQEENNKNDNQDLVDGMKLVKTMLNGKDFGINPLTLGSNKISSTNTIQTIPMLPIFENHNNRTNSETWYSARSNSSISLYTIPLRSFSSTITDHNREKSTYKSGLKKRTKKAKGAAKSTLSQLRTKLRSTPEI